MVGDQIRQYIALNAASSFCFLFFLIHGCFAFALFVDGADIKDVLVSSVKLILLSCCFIL